MASNIGVCLEVGLDGTGAFVPSCPGCWVFGRTPERALQKVRVAVGGWFAWLANHGEKVSVNTEFELDILEKMSVNYNPVRAGKPEPLFWSEVLPITKKDLAWTLRLMKYSREDLLNVVDGLTDDRLTWSPPNEPRTIRNCLRHIACVEPWYMSRLNIDLQCERTRNVFSLLDCTRLAVVNCLESFPREKMRGVFQPTKDTSPMCNLWTARKVLRRLVDHERLHTRYIERVLGIVRGSDDNW
jgi:predicted RNase H-like HicB family nuclease